MYMYIYIYIYIYIYVYIYIYIHIYIYIYIYIYPGYHHNSFAVTHALGHKMYVSSYTSFAQVHHVLKLPQSHCGDNREDTLFS